MFFIQNTLQHDYKNVERPLFCPNIEECFIVKVWGFWSPILLIQMNFDRCTVYLFPYEIEHNSYLFLILAASFIIIIYPLFDGSIGSVNNSWFGWQYCVRQPWSLTSRSVYSSVSWQPCVRYILYVLFKMGSEKLAQTGLLLIHFTDDWYQIYAAIVSSFSYHSGVTDDSFLMGCDSVLFGEWFVTFQRTVAP